jgi:hypothetical protein
MGIRNPCMETIRIRDPEWKKVGFGIRDKHPGSATLDFYFYLHHFWDLEAVLGIRMFWASRIRIH